MTNSPDGTGISQIANAEKPDKPGTMWNCPMCFKRVKFGTNGCDDPRACPEEKNFNYEKRYGKLERPIEESEDIP